jgi:3-dehydroquinate dehydratase-1
MINLNTRILNREMPAIAVAFDAICDAEKIATLKTQGLDVAEIRVDLFKDGSTENIIQALQNFTDLEVPTILTFRPTREGGNWQGSDLDRVDLIAKCYSYANIVDIESSSMHAEECDSTEQFCQLAKSILAAETQLLISYHNFENTPSLQAINHEIALAEALLSAQPDIVKVACQVDSSKDVATLTALLTQNPDKKMVVIGMGEQGLVTRLSFASYGSLLTFAYVGDTITAPGQLDIDATATYLRDFYPAYN